MIKEKKIGFIGVGKMGTALLTALINVNMPREKIYASDKYRWRDIKRQFRVNTATNEDVVKQSEIIILAVQPKDLPNVLGEVFPFVTDNKLIISIAAGVRIDSMRVVLKNKGRLIRVMPNVAALVREAVSGIYCGPKTTKGDEELAVAIFNLIGKTVVIHEESLMDAVTGLSGSGPAYVFEIIEALADGGVKVGLKREDALKLAAQTVKGAAEMILGTGKHPAVLKDMVASPGGTTIYGLAALEKSGVRGALIEAVVAASKRSEELGS